MLRILSIVLLATLILAACGSPAPAVQVAGEQAASVVTVFKSPT